jgi:CxxC-x17-CxxC domain-containing protein
MDTVSNFNTTRGRIMAYNDKFGGGGGGFRRDSGPKETHKAKCSDCGKDCEVPFKPSEGRPVFCKDCYKKRKGY